MRVLLMVCGFVVFVGCGAGDTFSNIQYPNAPVISIKQTKIIWYDKGLFLQYRLEATEPLPYDVEIKLSVSGTSQSADGQVHLIWGLQHFHGEKRDWHIHENDYHLLMRAETSVLGSSLKSVEESPEVRWADAVVAVYDLHPGDYYERAYYDKLDRPLHVDSISLKIVPWDGFGDDAYNVGKPHSLVVKR